MKIRELSNEELLDAKMRAGLCFGHPTFSDGWDAAINFAKYIEQCTCRCRNCHTPVGMGLNYGGDIMGEYTYCKDCWAKMSEDDKMRILHEDFSHLFKADKSKKRYLSKQ
jgi:hypothetical protein